jgi:alpha-tubulin suppressor-like RCC1 family protein
VFRHVAHVASQVSPRYGRRPVNRVRPLRVLLSLGLVAGLAALLGPVRADTPPPIVDIWTWGDNNGGQLGGVPPNATLPSPMREARRWVAVSAGNEHTLALTDTGEVWAWGRNSDGQLGDGTNNDSILPVRVQGPTGVTLIAAGGLHSLAYRASDTTLWAWGSNSVGQIAQASDVAASAAPVQVPISGPLQALRAGGAQSLALAVDGSVYAWGGNSRGQLGVGDFQDRRSPTLVPLPRAAMAIGAGGAHSLAALAPDGQVYAWGWNVFGQLGRGNQGTPTTGEPIPAPVLNVPNAVEVSGGDLHCLARTADGHVWAWGYNTEGQVGNGPPNPTTDSVPTPVLLQGIDSVTAIDAGGIHSMALRSNGEVWTWGNGQFGACGTNQRRDSRSPDRAILVEPAVAISAGGKFSIALAAPKPSSRVVVLGADGTTTPAERPALHDAASLGDIIQLSSGWTHTLALDAQHRVWAWGNNASGQLGVSGSAVADPVALDLPLEGAEGFVQIVARADHSLALRSDGAVWAWGDDMWGQLGIGAASPTALPTRVPVPNGVVLVAAGERHGLALDRDGAVWAWGQNLHGELGVPPTDQLTLTPAVVPSVIGPVSIAAGGFHSLAVDVDGGLLAWGSGYRGQLGRANLLDSYAPVRVDVPNDITAVSAGRFHTLVTRAGGGIVAFGDNTECQIAASPRVETWSPTPIAAAGYAVAVQAGDYHGLALDYAGGVMGWGNDSGGQLGRNDTTLPHYDCDPTSLPLIGATVLGAGLVHSVVAVTSAASHPDASTSD